MRKQPSYSGQMSLGGFESKPPSDRLFFGIFPDAATAERIAAIASSLRHAHALHGQPLQPSRFHVTLFHLGDHIQLRQDIVDAASSAAENLQIDRFDVYFDSASSFQAHNRKQPLVLRGPGEGAALYTFWQALGRQLSTTRLGEYVPSKFTPHVTLLYDERALDRQTIEPIAWTVREFVLIHSLLGRTEHRVLGRWALR